MRMSKTETESTQLWITIGQQPGLGGWLNVWLVSRTRRPKPAKPDKGIPAAKRLPQGVCTA